MHKQNQIARRSRRRSLLSIRCRKRDPKHVPYPPNSAQYRYGQDNLYPADAGAQHRSRQQLYPKRYEIQSKDLIFVFCFLLKSYKKKKATDIQPSLSAP